MKLKTSWTSGVELTTDLSQIERNVHFACAQHMHFSSGTGSVREIHVHNTYSPEFHLFFLLPKIQ